ncbi:hypothetical protein ACRAWF_42475 [Streptomyces sp. L7]
MDVMGEGHGSWRDPAAPRHLGRTKGVDVQGDPGSLTWVELYTDVAVLLRSTTPRSAWRPRPPHARR